jgi:hypothetical protein
VSGVIKEKKRRKLSKLKKEKMNGEVMEKENGTKNVKEELVKKMKRKVYEVEAFSLGDKKIGDKIIFKSLEDMEKAYDDIDNGRDIYVQEADGLISKILNQAINSKIYEGTIKLSARKGKNEEVEKVS